MYIPEHFEAPGVDAMHALIRDYPLATLVIHSRDGLDANHVPLHLSTSPQPYGSLRGHIARANPLFSEITQGAEALVIFHGPDAYITPSWYASKKLTGKVVPTWNYAVVHAHGVLRAVEKAPWLRAQIEALTTQSEASFAEPWSVSDAPADYIEKAMKAIVGIEMVIARMSGKWKASQNQPQPNRAGVVAGLQSTNLPQAHAVAALMEGKQQNP